MDNLRAFAAYDWSNESYILLDSQNANDRFFIYDQRVSLAAGRHRSGGIGRGQSPTAWSSTATCSRARRRMPIPAVPTGWTWATDRSPP